MSICYNLSILEWSCTWVYNLTGPLTKLQNTYRWSLDHSLQNIYWSLDQSIQKQLLVPWPKYTTSIQKYPLVSWPCSMLHKTIYWFKKSLKYMYGLLTLHTKTIQPNGSFGGKRWTTHYLVFIMISPGHTWNC